MTAPTSRGSYLIREELGGEALLAPVSSGVSWPVRPGAVYEILNSTSFENIPIIQATKDGSDLIITLAGGEQIVLTNYFVNDDPADYGPNARVDQSLPLQLSALDYSQPSEPPTSQFGSAPQFSLGPVTLPPQPYYPQQGDYPHPEQIPPYGYEENDGWGSGILGIAGIALGGLALATVGLQGSKGSSQIVNNAGGDGSKSNSDGSNALSTALDLAVEDLIGRSKSLTLPEEQELYDSIQQDIRDLLSLQATAPSNVGTSSALDLAVKNLIERSKSLTLPEEQELYDSIQQNIKDLLTPSLGSTNADDGIVINNNNYFGSSNSSAAAEPNPATISSITITRDDDYFIEGETVTVTVKFTDKVTAGDPDQLTFEFNDGDYVAQYAEGNGSNTITYELLVPAINAVTELGAANATFELGGSTFTDSNNLDVDLTDLPAWQGKVYVEPLPKIVEITAVPDQGEFVDDLDAGGQITFFVKYDNPVSYQDDKLTLALNSGRSAVFVDQTNPNGEAVNTYLKFVYTLQDGEEANDPAKELLPSALAENGGANIKTPNGSDARTQISDEVITTFKEAHEIIYDLSQPAIASFDLINITTDGFTIDRNFGGAQGLKTLLKVSGTVRITYDEPVVTVPAQGDLPELAIFGLLTDEVDGQNNFDPKTGRASYSEALTRPNVDSPNLNLAQTYEFSDVYIVLEDPTALPDVDPNPNKVLLSAAEGLIENMANILGEGGVPASSKLPVDADIGETLPTKDGGWDITVGAGPFMADSVILVVDDYDLEANDIASSFPQNIHQYQMVYARDANGFEDNYLDEFTGDLKDLSTNGSGVLRALVSGGSEVREAFVTPISELMVQVVESSGSPKKRDIHDAKTLISSFFHVGEFIHTEASFINATDVDGAVLEPVDVSIAVALASLSAMDFVSGSLWNTLEILKPIFLANASTEELTAAQQLIDRTRQIIGSSGSNEFDIYADEISELFAGMSDYLEERRTLLDDGLTIVHDETEYVLDEIELNSLVEHQTTQSFAPFYEQLAVDLGETFEPFGSGAIEYREWEIE